MSLSKQGSTLNNGRLTENPSVPQHRHLWAHPLYRPKKSQTALGILEKWTHFLTGGSGLELGDLSLLYR